MKIEEGDEVLVRGRVVWIESTEELRVEFPGYGYPIRVSESAIEKVIKHKLRRDTPD